MNIIGFNFLRVEDFQSITLNYDENGTLCQTPENPQDVQDDEYICSDEEIAHRINQTLWPDHCVMGTEEAEFGTQLGLQVHESDIVIQKGFNCEVVYLASNGICK